MTADSVLVARELQKLEDLQNAIRSAQGGGDLRGRIALVQLRRQLISQMMALDAVATEYVDERGSATDLADYRRRFAALRAATAFHQTKWPVVLIADDAVGYSKSADQVRGTWSDLASWLAGFLGKAGGA